ncbi:MAG: hypothetical protein ABIO40_11245, partial [Devosia sp.]
MSRLTSSVIALIAAAGLCGAPARAADYDGGWGGGSTDEGFEDFRDSYPVTPAQWAGLGDEDDPIAIEFGARYWYSIGGHDFNTFGGNFTSEDTSHLGELYLRVEDHSTNSFAKAVAGYSMLVQGNYEDPFNGVGTVDDGYIGYAGADFGWNPFGNNAGSGAGFLVGYMFWNDSPATERASYTTQLASDPVAYNQETGETFLPYDSSPNNIDIHMMRLGVQGKADLGGIIDVEGELAAVPFAKIDGIIGADETTTTLTPLGNIASIKS